MTKRLFGTDGIRGRIGKEILPSLAYKVGRYAVSVLKDAPSSRPPHFLVATDTRISKDSISLALCSGITAAGGRVTHLGVLPTPAVSYLTVRMRANAGVMVSASHNPYYCNGIKIFSSDGKKLSDELEEKIESLIEEEKHEPLTCDGSISFVNMTEAYVSYLQSSASCSLKKMRIGVDCANGAAYASAKFLFERLGIEALFTGDRPDGKNINLRCGSTDLSSLSRFVKEQKLDLGIAFDGDADRLLAVDENGREADGDVILAICAEYLLATKRLKGGIVGTVMSNLGLRKYCESRGIGYIEAPVGDRHVSDKMTEHGYNLGGEQSGHIIFSDLSNAGDGQLSAIKLLEAISFFDLPMSSLVKIIKKYPQVTVNIPANENAKALISSPSVIMAKENAQRLLGDNGRIILRASGTEPLIRIMAEGESTDEILAIANSIRQAVEKAM